MNRAPAPPKICSDGVAPYFPDAYLCVMGVSNSIDIRFGKPKVIQKVFSASAELLLIPARVRVPGTSHLQNLFERIRVGPQTRSAHTHKSTQIHPFAPGDTLLATATACVFAT